MNYKETIADFFKQLHDHKTICGIQVGINEVDWKKVGSTSKTYRENPLRRYLDGQNNFVILLRDGCIDYDKEIENVVHEVRSYLTTVPTEMRPAMLSQVHDVINREKKQLPIVPGIDFHEFTQYKKDIRYLFNTTEFPPESDLKVYIKGLPKKKGKGPTVEVIRESWLAEYDMETIYKSCLLERLIRRNEIIQKLETQLSEIITGVNHGHNKKGVKVKWKGNLKEFADLIFTLQKNNWIGEIEHGQLNKVVQTFTDAFDFTDTKTKKDSDTLKSLLQIMKPSEKDDKVYSKRYVAKFDLIKSNISRK